MLELSWILVYIGLTFCWAGLVLWTWKRWTILIYIMVIIPRSPQVPVQQRHTPWEQDWHKLKATRNYYYSILRKWDENYKWKNWDVWKNVRQEPAGDHTSWNNDNEKLGVLQSWTKMEKAERQKGTISTLAHLWLQKEEIQNHFFHWKLIISLALDPILLSLHLCKLTAFKIFPRGQLFLLSGPWLRGKP